MDPLVIERPYKFRRFIFIGVIGFVALVCVLYFGFFRAPANFPKDAIVSLKEGMTLREISQALEDAHIVRSAVAFQSATMIVSDDHGARAGSYLFTKPANVLRVALRIAGGETGIPMKKVTFPEGITTREMASILEKSLPDFDAALFLRLAQPKEGYLFPDTYFFPENVVPNDVLTALNKNYNAKVADFQKDIDTSGHSEREIVIMASLLEREASGEEDIAMISGILWDRLDVGMRLQVDAPFYFLLGKQSKDLTQSDLALESAYNTYKHTGLPPGPIGNPGSVAIDAALHPKKSEYLYYLHDKDGKVHFARTFKEHESNIKAFL